ncbi:4258_t:CDS:2, partial [Scutellospora calospora]
VCLYTGQEKYDVLAKIGRIFEHELRDLKHNGLLDSNGIHWPVELYFCGDWKFMYIVMGLNAPNAKYFCLYCNCDAESQWNMDQDWTNSGNSKCKKKPSLFPAIDQENYIPDELHLLLRISDILMECFFNDLFKKKEFEKQIKLSIEAIFKSLAIRFEFFKSTSNKWDWTSLMGPDKKKMLEKFPVSQFISGTQGKDIEQLWREFYRLYNVIRKSQLSNQEIDQYKVDAENWIRTFCRPTQGSINSLQKYRLYRKADITPYMHVFAKHIPLFMQQLKAKGLSLQFFSTS